MYRPSRRRFWTSLARASLTAGVTALVPRWTFPREAGATGFDQFGSLDGALRTDPETLRSYAQDYGQIIHEMPRAVLMPESVEDIARMIVFARRAGQGEEQIRNIPFAEYAGGLPPVPTGSCHADLGLCLPACAVHSFVTEMLPRLNPDDLGAAAAVGVSFWKREHFRAPLLRVPVAGDIVYLLFLRHDSSDRDVVARMLNGNRVLFERARRAGGTLYPYSALRMTSYDWEQHYGKAWRNLRRAKRRYDPARVLASGPDTL